MKNVPNPANPALVDRVLIPIQEELEQKLSWLNNAYGKAQMLIDKNKKTYPGVYYKNGEYLNVFPNDTLGNFSWFDIEDPYTVDYTPRIKQRFTAKYGLIFWFNLEKVLNDTNELRNLESIKNEILSVLTNFTLTAYGSALNVEKISERSKNIYKGYSIDESIQQYLMQPWAGLRFEGQIRFKQTC